MSKPFVAGYQAIRLGLEMLYDGSWQPVTGVLLVEDDNSPTAVEVHCGGRSLVFPLTADFCLRQVEP